MSDIANETIPPLQISPPTAEELDRLIAAALARLDRTMPQFSDHFPAPSSESGTYSPIDNVEWTNGFWTGMLWLGWELTRQDRYKAAAQQNVVSFADRIKRRVHVDHHDLGFLYTLSACAAYRLTGDEVGRAAGLEAAKLLLRRFDPTAEVIQAWGDMRDPAQRGRMIIDCNLNLPLLFWAGRETGDRTYADAATRHLRQAARYLVRPDASTYHTFYIDTASGRPRFGSTHQGYSDDSCWARGQAWGIYGFALGGLHTGDPEHVELAARLASYFLNRLPSDGICCWDLIFTDDDTTPRDSSAAAIAACGLIELARALPLSDSRRDIFANWAWRIAEELGANYLAPVEGSNALLLHAVYHMPNGAGVDEACIWGDYFYMEALMRLRHVWSSYWA